MSLLSLVSAPQRPANDWTERLSVSKSGHPHATIANATTVLVNAPEWSRVLTYNTFTNEVETLRAPPWDSDDRPDGSRSTAEPCPWTDQDDVRAANWLARHYQLRVGPEVAHAAARIAAEKTCRHPVREYLDGLDWDGCGRVNRWLTTYLGALDTPYTQLAGRMTLLSAVARVMSPGAKVDTMLVLEGAQGLGKSKTVRALFGPWCSDSPPDLASKDRFVGLRGRWGIEWSELDGLERGDIGRVKSFLSSPEDDYRPPYGRANVRVPRQCIFIGTVNTGDYLRDATGGRRFWPVKVSKGDIDALVRDRDQLWSEAVALYSDGAEWWPSDEHAGLFVTEQSHRAPSDVWETAVLGFIEAKSSVGVGDVLTQAIGIEPAKQGQVEQNRVVRILVAAGWERTRRRINGRPAWVYVPTSPGVGS